MKTLTLIKPDDWHVHLRDGAALQAVVQATARQFRRAIIMPNLRPPISTVREAMAYRTRIMAALSAGIDFEPLMTLYLTDRTTAEEIRAARASGIVHAVKYYPAGATTNSDSGVTTIRNAYQALAAMEQAGLPLLVHGEVTDAAVDIFDRERVFVETILQQIVHDFPQLKIVMEHITTREAAEFVQAAPLTVGATITPQHLLYNRNRLLVGGIQPHYYCLPILKRESHRAALVAAAVSGNAKFFLGTDSAPHAAHTKETGCGCAGCYSAPAALELYAEAFEDAGALDRLEAFASFNGPDFYGLPRNTATITLERREWVMPADFSFGNDRIVPLKAGESVRWKLVEPSGRAADAA